MNPLLLLTKRHDLFVSETGVWHDACLHMNQLLMNLRLLVTKNDGPSTTCDFRYCCVAVCCSVLQCVAVCCSVLQCVAAVGFESRTPQWLVPFMSAVLQCVAVCCSVLQCVAVCCSSWQSQAVNICCWCVTWLICAYARAPDESIQSPWEGKGIFLLISKRKK